MKRAFLTLATVLTLVGIVGLTRAMASIPEALYCAPSYTNYIGAPGSCPTMAAVSANTPKAMGTVGF